MWDNQYLSTEIALLKSIGIPLKYKGNLIIESKLFPTFYGGNLIFVDKKESPDLEHFEKLFIKYFTAPKTKHKTFLLTPGGPNFDQLIKKATEKEYEITHCNYLAMPTRRCSFPLADSLSIDALDLINNDKDISDYLELMKAEYDLEWFWKEGFKKKQTLIKTMDIKYFGLREKGSSQIRSSLGLFQYGTLARFQEVVTHPDFYRNGYATILLNHGINHAHEVFKTKEVVIQADKNYHAYHLYRNLGFKDVFEVSELMKF